jgi:hypothetical protein
VAAVLKVPQHTLKKLIHMKFKFLSNENKVYWPSRKFYDKTCRLNRFSMNTSYSIKKGDAIPLTSLEGIYGCETSRFPHFSDNRLTGGGEVVSLKRRPPFAPKGRFLVLISVRDRDYPRAIERLKGLDQFKSTVTSSGIEPATFRLVA